MNANDVYNIAKALPQEELQRLCNMLVVDTRPKKPLKKRKPEINFTVDDGIRYLLKTHFSKVKTH